MSSQALFDHVSSVLSDLERRAAAVRAELANAGARELPASRLRALLGEDEGGVGEAYNALWGPAHWDHAE